jgi:hypothetical protein
VYSKIDAFYDGFIKLWSAPGNSWSKLKEKEMRFVARTFILMMFMAAISYAEERTKVEGLIKDPSGVGISGVSVTIRSSLGTGSGSTDKQGKYSVLVTCSETSKHTVTPSKPGYVFIPPSRPWDKYSAGPSFTGRKQ